MAKPFTKSINKVVDKYRGLKTVEKIKEVKPKAIAAKKAVTKKLKSETMPGMDD